MPRMRAPRFASLRIGAALLAVGAAVFGSVHGTPTRRSIQLDGTLTRAAPTLHEARAPIADPLLAQQWGLQVTRASGGWRLASHGRRVIVAVVDSGVDASHPDLAGKVLAGWNAIDGSTNTADDNGHGTAVAGIIAAVTGNGVGVASYCARCVILPVKVLDAHGAGTPLDVARGIRWAVDHGARVVNVSIGTGDDDPILRQNVAYAAAHGVLVVGSAGNLGDNEPSYPAADPGALAVAATDAHRHLFTWSTSGAWVQLAAPGSNLTTGLGGYSVLVGTSAAAPVVAGIAALALTAAPRTPLPALVAALEKSAVPVAGVAYGEVDATRTVSAVVTAAAASSNRRT